jgi:hypothetical protein
LNRDTSRCGGRLPATGSSWLPQSLARSVARWAAGITTTSSS